MSTQIQTQIANLEARADELADAMAKHLEDVNAKLADIESKKISVEHIYVPKEILDCLEDIAKENNASLEDVIFKALEHFMQNHKKENSVNEK